MVVKQASLAVVVAACAALFAAPVFAADAPAGAPAAPAASSNMGAMHMAPAKKAHAAHAAHAKKSAKKTAAEHHAKHHGKRVASKHKFSCYDYAWQSADMQNCLAKHKKS